MAKGGSRKQIELGKTNREAVRAYFATHLCATQVDCARDTGIGIMAVSRHCRAIRAEWCDYARPADRDYQAVRA